MNKKDNNSEKTAPSKSEESTMIPVEEGKADAGKKQQAADETNDSAQQNDKQTDAKKKWYEKK